MPVKIEIHIAIAPDLWTQEGDGQGFVAKRVKRRTRSSGARRKKALRSGGAVRPFRPYYASSTRIARAANTSSPKAASHREARASAACDCAATSSKSRF